MSVRKASVHFQVPRNTLGDRMRGKIGDDAKPGKAPIIPIEVEDAIVTAAFQVFSPFQSVFDTCCSTYMAQDPKNMVSKDSVCALIGKACAKGFTRTNIVSGFESTSVVPWSLLAIPRAAAFAPSQPFDVKPNETTATHTDHPMQWVVDQTANSQMVEAEVRVVEVGSQVEVCLANQQEDDAIAKVGTLTDIQPVTRCLTSTMHPPLPVILFQLNLIPRLNQWRQ
jgi:hypothetical protein